MDRTDPDGRAALVLGAGRYVADVQRPGQRWLSVVRSPVAHGRLRGVDGSEALRAPGVHAVLDATAFDGEVPRIPIRVWPHPAMEGRLQPVLAVDRVRYVGEPVAIVVADSAHLAEDAAELVELDIEPLVPVTDVAQVDPPPLSDDHVDNVLCDYRGAAGDLEAAFAAAAVVVRVPLSISRHTGLPMETRGLVAEFRDGLLHLWGVTKLIHFTRRVVAASLGLTPEDVVCHQVDVGGMFGVRGEVYPEDVLVPWAAQHVGSPVAWVEDRREHLLSINHSREQYHQVELAMAADGELLALRDDLTIDFGAFPRPIGSRLAQLTVEALPGPYRWRALDAHARGVATCKTPVGTMRGPAAYEATFVRERAIDLAARQLGLDPVAVRLRNLIPHDALPYHVHLGDELGDVHYDSGDYPAIARAALEAFDLDGTRTEVARRRADGERVGLGAAFFVEHSGVGAHESVGLRLAEDGQFVLGTSAVEVGQGLAPTVSTVLCELLEVPADRVEIDFGHSGAHDAGTGTFASRTTIFLSAAAHDAAGQLLDEARRRAAERWGTDPEVLEREPDGFTWQGEHLHFKELAPIEVRGEHRMEVPTVGFGLALAVVRVDTGTGGVDVERIDVGYDIGRAIDPKRVEQQLVGAAVQGVGGALFEELAYDGDGQPLSTTFLDYLVPTAAEAPQVRTFVVESEPAPGNPLGLKGAGEAGITPVGAIVANAVADALDLPGDVFTRLPIKPEDVASAAAEAARKDP